MSATSQIFLGVVFLMFGCAIYLLFRSKSLNIYQWCTSLGLSNAIDYARSCVRYWSIPDSIRFSLPDSLYCASYILIMDAIWQDSNYFIKYSVISVVPIVTIGSEIFQYFGLIKGTYDFLDLVFYSVPFIAYVLYKYYTFKLNILNF